LDPIKGEKFNERARPVFHGANIMSQALIWLLGMTQDTDNWRPKVRRQYSIPGWWYVSLQWSQWSYQKQLSISTEARMRSLQSVRASCNKERLTSRA
jgi:hypothetical protein